MAENRDENEAEDKVSVAQLLKRKDLYAGKEEAEGSETIAEDEQNISPGKTVA